MSLFFGRRGDRDDHSPADRVTYVCPGCRDWQLDAPNKFYRDIDPKAVDDALTEHREECPPLQAIYSRAHARQADKEVPVAPSLAEDFDALTEIEAEIADLARKAARSGRMHRDYVAWHARIDELLTWRDTVIDARGGKP